MRRREFITLLGGAAAAWPFTAGAQQPDRIARVGMLGPNLDAGNLSKTGYEILLSELQKLGFISGQNLVMEYRRTDEGKDKAIIGAKELVDAKVDVIIATGAEISLQAATSASSVLPIVMIAINYDPIARGYVKSLAHPGSHVTGLFFRQPELAAKQLELLKEAFPEKTRLGILWDAQSADQFSVAERAAQSIRLPISSIKLEIPPYDFDAAFRTIVKKEAQFLLVLSSPSFAPQATHIAELAIRNHLPAMFIFKNYVKVGGLMSYGVNYEPVYRRAASYVAKILRGVQTSDIPVEQVDNFELAVNLKTAKMIGVNMPTSILIRADEVIE